MTRYIDADELEKRTVLVEGDEFDGEYVIPYASFEMVPTVDAVTVIHAHYIYKNFDDYECSNCHVHCHVESVCTIYNNYCPNCGAKMDAKIEEKE